jgi:hypothetical protein
MKIYETFIYFHSQIKNRQAGSDQEGGGFATLVITTLMLRIQKKNTQIHDTHYTDIQLKTPNIMTLRITTFSTMTPALSIIMLSVAIILLPCM